MGNHKKCRAFVQCCVENVILSEPIKFAQGSLSYAIHYLGKDLCLELQAKDLHNVTVVWLCLRLAWKRTWPGFLAIWTNIYICIEGPSAQAERASQPPTYSCYQPISRLAKMPKYACKCIAFTMRRVEEPLLTPYKPLKSIKF